MGTELNGFLCGGDVGDVGYVPRGWELDILQIMGKVAHTDTIANSHTHTHRHT